MRWSDIDVRARELTVHQQLAIEPNKPVLKQLKTESANRIVTFGASTSAVQERLGHADIGVTLNTYTHTVTKQHKQAGVHIDKVFGSST